LANVTNSTLNGLTLSYSGAGPVGVGLELNGVRGDTIENLTIAGRDTAIRMDGADSNNTIETNALGGNSGGIAAFLSAGSSGNQFLNNDLSNTNGTAIYLQSDANFTISGNNLAGSASGVVLQDMTGATITTSNLSIDTSQVTGGNALTLANVTNSTLNGLTLSYSGGGTTGIGLELNDISGDTIENLILAGRDIAIRMDGTDGGNTIETSSMASNGSGILAFMGNGSSGNQFLNNNLSNISGTALLIQSDTQFTVSGNNLAGSANGVVLQDMTGATISTSNLSIDASQVTGGNALTLNDVTNSTLNGLTLSYVGNVTTGTGLDLNGDTGDTIENLTIAGRIDGIQMGGADSTNTIESNTLAGDTNGIAAFMAAGSSGNRFSNNDLSNSAGTALTIQTDVNFTVSGNNFAGSANGVTLQDMTGATVTASNLSIDVSQVAAGNALTLSNLANSTLSGLTLSYAGPGQSGTGLLVNNGSSGLTVQNLVVSERATGISLQGASEGATITGSSVYDNVDGIIISGGTGQTLSGNAIAANSMIGLANETGAQIDAAGNWWGAENGPDGGVDASNNGVSGSGDMVTGNVLVTPFLTSLAVTTTADSGAGTWCPCPESPHWLSSTSWWPRATASTTSATSTPGPPAWP
ncbi:MAG TPA: right-handed parallel beta-helix repeat-containing protein, partial [Pirellulales bacterium]|nr:right-handed parallel beta-helix repeat-containing protein [Pirellulales bacterium]